MQVTLSYSLRAGAPARCPVRAVQGVSVSRLTAAMLCCLLSCKWTGHHLCLHIQFLALPKT